MKTGRCDQCGNSYKTKPYLLKKPGHHFCSAACYGEFQRGRQKSRWADRIAIDCRHCGKSVVAYAWQTTKQFCSVKCRNESQLVRLCGSRNPAWRGGHSCYRGPNWRRQRMAALDRDNWKCLRCGSEKQLNVHHARPFRLFGDYRKANSLGNLRTLCSTCHGVEEQQFWTQHPELIGQRPAFFLSWAIECRKCGEDFLPRSGAGKVCDSCCTAFCRRCGCRFYSRRGVSRTLAYCSRVCRNADKRLPSKACAGCGKSFRPRYASRKYCSVHCHNTNDNPRRRFAASQSSAALR